MHLYTLICCLELRQGLKTALRPFVNLLNKGEISESIQQRNFGCNFYTK